MGIEQVKTWTCDRCAKQENIPDTANKMCPDYWWWIRSQDKKDVPHNLVLCKECAVMGMRLLDRAAIPTMEKLWTDEEEDETT